MTRLARRWTHYWFAPGPLFDLGVARIVIVATQMFVLLVRSDHHAELLALAALPDELYDPLPALHVLVAPLGWRYRPGFEVLETIFWIAVVSGVTSLIGLVTNASLAVFAWANVFLRAFEYSFGEYHHNDEVMMIALVVLTLSPAGGAVSLDAWRRRRRARAGREAGDAPFVEGASRFARWPLLIVAWMLALAYVSAAFHKLQAGGLDWMNGHTLQWYIIQDAMRNDLPIGLWVGQQFGLVLVLSWLTVAWEATFFLVLLLPALAWIYVPIGIGFHMGTWLLMDAGFFQFIGLYSVFVPWAAAYAWLLRRRQDYGVS